MENIFKALNVTSEKELNNLVESLDLEIDDYIKFMTMLDETLQPSTIRENVLSLTESLYNGSYKKLQEQISKKPFERKLKEETVYDHSWYEVKKQKYPKRTKDGVICESKEDIENENDVENDSIEEPKQKSSADPEITQFINTTEKVINNTTNIDILKSLLDSINVKITLAVDVEQMNKLGELKQKTETKIMSSQKIDQISEAFDYDNYVPSFNVGDNVEFVWGDVKYTGRVINVIDRGSYEYYNIISYVEENQRRETFTHVDPIDNEMKKLPEDDYEDDDLNETCSAGATCAGSVSGFAKPIGQTIKRKKKVKETFDSKLFKESILNEFESASKINGKQLRYFLNEGKFYLSVNNALVKTFDKDVMIETVDMILGNEDVSDRLLEGYSCYEMNILMEDVTANPLSPTGNELNKPRDNNDNEHTQELEDMVGDTDETVSIISPEDDYKITSDQKLVDVDKEKGIAIVKGPDGKISYVDDRTVKISESLLTEGIADVAKYFPKLDIESIKEVVRMDPTYTGGDQLGKYSKWILRLVSNNVKNIENQEKYRSLLKQYPDGINPKNGQPFQAPIRLPEVTNEDRYKITQSLKKYDIYKEEIGKPLDSFKTLPELDAAISDVEERGVPAEKLARQRLSIFHNAMKKGLKRVYEDGKWIVGIPETHESSKMFGDETSWCTTSNGSYYDHYSSQGPLFINLNKDNGRLYQFHFQSASFMDEHDSTQNWEDGGDIGGFFSENPFLEHFYKDYVRHEEDPKKIVNSIVNNKDKLDDIFDDVYNLHYDGKCITGTLDVERIDPIYRDRDRDTVSLSFISKMLSGDWWEAFNYYDEGHDGLDYLDSEFKSEIKRISEKGGIDLTKIKWSEIMEILRTDGSEATENFTEEEATELYVKMENDFSDDMSIWSVFSDCKRNGAADEAYNDIKSDLVDNLPLNPKEPFNNSDLNIYIPYEDLVGMCTDNSTVRVDIESDTTWYDRLQGAVDFSNGWLYAWYSSKNSSDSFGIYEPNYGWDGFDDSQWRYAISNFVHYIHTMKRGVRNENQ